MIRFLNDDQMWCHEVMFAAACIGGMAEGYDYSKEKEKCQKWANLRRAYHYNGGWVDVEKIELADVPISV